jgi:hypothetical protein
VKFTSDVLEERIEDVVEWEINSLDGAEINTFISLLREDPGSKLECFKKF